MLYLNMKSHPISANPSRISTYKIRKNNSLSFQHLRNPLVSAHSKGTSTPLDSAVARPLFLTPLQSTLTEKQGGGGVIMVNYISQPSWPPATRHWPSISTGRCLRRSSMLQPTDFAAFTRSAPALAPFSPSTSVLRSTRSFLYLLSYCPPAPPHIDWAFIRGGFP